MVRIKIIKVSNSKRQKYAFLSDGRVRKLGKPITEKKYQSAKRKVRSRRRTTPNGKSTCTNREYSAWTRDISKY